MLKNMIERMRERFPLIRPLLIPLVFYMGLLAFSVSWMPDNPDSNWRWAVALLPMIPGVFIAIGVVRAILKLDELAKKIILEALAVSFSCTLVLILSLALLELAGLPHINPVYTALFMSVVWLVAKLIVARKYE